MKKYQLIANTIKQRIKDGVYPQQSFLPKQEELAEEFSVSKITIKSALDQLEREGFVYKESGLGTMVLSNLSLLGKNDSPVNSFTGLSAENDHDQVTSKVLKFEVAFPSTDLREKLNLEENDPVYEIVRLRLVNNEPLVIEHTFMPVSQVPALSKKILEGSIYSYLHKKLHIKFGGGFRRIKADLPDEYDLKYLGASENTPILEIEQIVWTNSGVNIEYSRSRNLFNKRSYIMVETSH
ncbi:transcriptional regulator [Lactobacillus nasalidis]|uniref:Transcriptional regulator n=1 Tax=Lactobacillus nasalidis TaxID=2797258 RepID=A0ABQ3W5J1_9LACO|nr:GntR family transcriptional regulator [Lactobacillus nasalidis]GHV97598.1 transcriptional regulator [Lactobacillus nasalidis]GHW00194.1 transcriptional regulator [Lactobacillus nasalidis]GHW01273.1 transcriptional regulator [Lactobacillus nasalidis]